MPRYAKQTDGFRCGPFALLNVLKWAGVREYKGAPIDATTARTELADLCRCDEDGTGIMDLDKALRTFPEIKVKRVWKIKPGILKKHLRKGGVAIVGFDYIGDAGLYEGHFGFFTETSKTHLTCINFKEQTKYKMPHKEFRRMFYKRFPEPTAWLIDRDYKVGEIVKLKQGILTLHKAQISKNEMHIVCDCKDDGRIIIKTKLMIWPPNESEVTAIFPTEFVKRTIRKEKFLYHILGSKALIEERKN